MKTMETNADRPSPANGGHHGQAQWIEDVSHQLDLLPPELDGNPHPRPGHPSGDSTGHDEEQVPIVEDDHSISPSSSSVPSAATTRVNSGLDGDDLNPSIAQKLETTITSVELHDAPVDGTEPVDDHPDSLSKKMKGIRSLLILYSVKTIHTGLFTAFIIIVLINKIVETPGGVYWNASTTNYVVSVLSQLSVLLTTTTIHDLFTILRPVLASRQGQVQNGQGARPGTSFASWVGLSPAAGWASVCQVAAVGGFLNPWCNMRLLLPILMLGFGSILKFDVEFEYYFIAGPPEAKIPVYAGLNVPNVQLLRFINASDLAMYENTWSSALLGVSLFAKDFDVPDCPPETCRSVLLPGGLPNARLVGPQLNLTLYSIDNFKNSDAITIYDAKGFVVKFETSAPESLAFDLTRDCAYGGQGIDNGVQVCVKQDGDSLVVGWSSCPIELYDRKMCNDANATWRTDPIQSGTRMSLFSQVATTSYDRKNQSILNVETRDSDLPQPVALSAEDYKQIFDHAMQTKPQSSIMDTNNINALDYTVAWMQRTFRKSFETDSTSMVTFLHNFLATPVQFNFVAHIYANYTAVERGFGRDLSLFSLPDEMISLARGGRSASRLAILPWAGWVFIGVDLALHLAVFVGIGWVLFRGKAVRSGLIGVEDLDAVRVSRDTRVVFLDERGTVGGRSWFTEVRYWLLGRVSGIVPGRCRDWWDIGREEDTQFFRGTGGYENRGGEEGIMTEEGRGRTVMHVGLDPYVNVGENEGGIPAWRLARGAPGWMVRFVMR